MLINPVGILAAIVTFQLLFLAFFLLGQKTGRRVSNILLALFFILLAINMFDFLLQILDVRAIPPVFFILDDTLLLLLGPVILMYTRSIIFPSFGLKIRHGIHLLPFLVFLILFALIPFTADPEVSHSSILEAEVPLLATTTIGLFYIHALGYLFFSKYILNTYARHAREFYSNAEKISLNWLHFVLHSFMALGILGILQLFLPRTGHSTLYAISGMLFITLLFVFVYRSLYLALKHGQNIMGISVQEKEKYADSPLSDSQRVVLAEQLTTLFSSKQLYQNPNLTIGDVAIQLGVTAKLLSQVINQTFHQHFFDFVNTYRIDKSKEMLSNPENSMNVQEIMYAVGFSSKSSFNTIFKRKTKKTPTQFRDSMGN